MALIYPPALGSIPSPSSLTPTLNATTFSGEAGVGTHDSTDWQVATSDTFSSASLVYNQNDTVNLNSLTIPAATLVDDTFYYVRVRHRDDASDISNWSQVAEFNTGLPIGTPVVTVSSPTPLIPVITSSAFVGANTHTRTDWQIASDLLDRKSVV